MSLVERKISRRSLITKGTLFVTGFISFNLFGCKEDSSASKSPYENVIGLNNLNDRKILDQIKEESQNFQILRITSLAEIVPDKPFQIGSLTGSQKEFLKKYGIAELGFGKNIDTGNVFLVLNFHTNVKVGNLYDNPPTPIPAFVFSEDENKIIATTSAFEWYYRDKELTIPSALINEFPIKPESLSGTRFVIYLNVGLISVDDKNLPSFSLPYRFLLETA